MLFLPPCQSAAKAMWPVRVEESMRRRIALLVGLGVLAAPVLWITQAQGASPSLTSVTVPLTRIGSASFGNGTTSGGSVVDTTEIDQATLGDTDSGSGDDDV